MDEGQNFYVRVDAFELGTSFYPNLTSSSHKNRQELKLHVFFFLWLKAFKLDKNLKKFFSIISGFSLARKPEGLKAGNHDGGHACYFISYFPLCAFGNKEREKVPDFLFSFFSYFFFIFLYIFFILFLSQDASL